MVLVCAGAVLPGDNISPAADQASTGATDPGACCSLCAVLDLNQWPAPAGSQHRASRAYGIPVPTAVRSMHADTQTAASAKIGGAKRSALHCEGSAQLSTWCTLQRASDSAAAIGGVHEQQVLGYGTAGDRQRPCVCHAVVVIVVVAAGRAGQYQSRKRQGTTQKS